MASGQASSASGASSPAAAGIWRLRLFTLLALCLSDGTYTVLRRYSQGVLRETYSFNEVLLAAEFLKLVFAVVMVQQTAAQNAEKKPLPKFLLGLLLRSQKMFVLAVLYGAGNILSFVALRRIGAGTFVIIAQMKTLTTAVCSSLILNRKYSLTKWRALVLLVAGVILFVLPTIEYKQRTVPQVEVRSSMMDTMIGCGLEFITVTISGFCSIYFEKVIKNEAEQVGIWERNFQLACWSIPSYAVMIVINGGGAEGFFQGWTPLAFILALFGCSGGLLVALSIKYGDSVLKTLAISGSIIYAAIVDHHFLGGPLTVEMMVAAIVVIIAIFNYTFDATPVIPASDLTPKQLNTSENGNAGSAKDIESSSGETWNENERQPFLNGSAAVK